MIRTSATYKVITGIIMILALLWLTISVPFVYRAQEELKKQTLLSVLAGAEDVQNDTEECNSFGNTTEEKTETNSNSLSEYLHYIDELSHLAGTSPEHSCSHSFSVYVAFHGEMLCPPPNFTLS